MVPLVFKTSLGAVRSPEGSTPSLLRQIDSRTVRRVQAQLVDLTCDELFAHTALAFQHPR